MAKILELSIIDNLAVAELLISSNYAGVVNYNQRF